MRDKRKPKIVGSMFNVPMVLVDGIFWVNDGPVDAIQTVYINGRCVNGPFANFATSFDLSIATIPPRFLRNLLGRGRAHVWRFAKWLGLG